MVNREMVDIKRHDEAALPGRVRWSRVAYQIIAWVLVLCVAVQIFLAGMGTFVSPTNWALHVTFIHFFELLPILLLILAFVGRLPARDRWLAVGMLVLVAVQYATAGMRLAEATRIVAALHPLTGFLFLWLAITAAQRVRRVME